MRFEQRDAAVLRLFETFVEAAPMMVLQLYIITSAWSQHSHAAHRDTWNTNNLYHCKSMMDRWMDGWMDGLVDGWMDRSIDRSIDQYTNK